MMLGFSLHSIIIVIPVRFDFRPRAARALRSLSLFLALRPRAHTHRRPVCVRFRSFARFGSSGGTTNKFVLS